MSYGAAGLRFATLREANLRRLPEFKNRRGEPAHSEPDGSDWALSAWCNAVLGELGEAADLIKKVERGDMTLDDARGEIARELADVQTYLDLLAFRADVDLGEATIQKWNEVSERIGSRIRIAEDDWHLIPTCHTPGRPLEDRCDRQGRGGFMGHTCNPGSGAAPAAQTTETE